MAMCVEGGAEGCEDGVGDGIGREVVFGVPLDTDCEAGTGGAADRLDGAVGGGGLRDQSGGEAVDALEEALRGGDEGETETRQEALLDLIYDRDDG